MTMMMDYCISFENVQEAVERIQGIAHVTPVLTSASFNNNSEQELFFKCEALQRTGSFKFRGALNAISAAVPCVLNNADSKHLHVVTHSSGNHAQALALAAKEACCVQNTPTTISTPTDVSCTIVMPRNAPTVKREAVVNYGGNVVLVDNTNEAREEGAEKIVREESSSYNTNAVFIHPSEDPMVIAGQGTVSMEMVRQIEELTNGYPPDAVVIPVGGGGLAAGNTIALRGLLGNKVKIILAEPAKLDDAKRSFETGKLLKHHPNNTLDSVADGVKTTLGPNTWPIIRDLVDDVMVVSELDIMKATKLVWERLKICIEPTAGVGVAVATSEEFRNKYSAECKRVAVILCGGNVDIIKTAKLMEDMGL